MYTVATNFENWSDILFSALSPIWFNKVIGSPWNSQEAIREELFSWERFEEHAKSLAHAQVTTSNPQSVLSLANRLKQNEAVLVEAHRVVAMAIKEGRSVSPGAEWLVDNSHLIEEQIREIRQNFPSGYDRGLPRLAGGPFSGYPRILGLSWAFVAHSDSRFDADLLKHFVSAYQSVEPLTIGELWAVSITLRVVLVENLRRAAERIVLSREQRHMADLAADALMHSENKSAIQWPAIISRFDGRELPLPFAAQLAQRLADSGEEGSSALELLKTRLSDDKTTVDNAVRVEHQRMAATNNTIRNIIRSMRILPDVDWTEFFEAVSLVDVELRRNAKYSEMDFATRNAYRTVVERLGRSSSLPEIQITKASVEMSKASVSSPAAQDPGYFLLGPGLSALKTAVGHRVRFRDIPAEFTLRGGMTGYLLSIAGLSFVALILPALAVTRLGATPGVVATLVLAGLLPAIELAIALVNHAITHELNPQILPGMSFDAGIPADARTLVVIPTLITSHRSLDEIFDRLETHHLATQQEHVFYAIASDFVDAQNEIMEGDAELVESAVRAIERLNRQYPPPIGSNDRFYLFHRRRLWNASQNCWMGWERKRGKLHELNRLLRGAEDTTYVATASTSCPPSNVRFVVTLDQDTRLPRDAVRRLVGKMMHPLNMPVFSEEQQRVVSGYSILQPRVTPSFPLEGDGSVYQKLFSTAGGIDPYAGAVSDVYQDLFAEGSFAGKGIYDIDAFEASTAGRFPQNTVLSHDLVEGIFARAALATDVEVVEEFPSRYDVARARDHRWARGDWQLLPWVITGTARFRPFWPHNAKNKLPLLGRWKLFDNLRRSSTPIMIVVAFVMGWMQSAAIAVIWTGFVLAAMGIPTFLSILSNIATANPSTTWSSHIRALAADTALAVSQTTLFLTLAADKAFSMSDAIARTLYRLFYSRKNLLEWTTAAQAKTMSAATVQSYYRRMWGGVAIAAASLVIAYVGGTNGIFVGLPVITVWLAAPALARWASFAETGPGRDPITAANKHELRLTARRTWRYFEVFVTPDDNFLPPDNFQEVPRPVVAHRTSPTNIGLYLLSIVSAQDFGWISIGDAADRLEQTLRVLARLEKYKGHYFNWYDTQSCLPLEPKYVSSVDSGNLAGHLIAIASTCRQWSEEWTIQRNSLAGIADSFALLKEAVAHTGRMSQTDKAVATFENALISAGGVTNASIVELQTLETHAATIRSAIENDAGASDALMWCEALCASVASLLRHAQLATHEQIALRRRLVAIADTADYLVDAMDFSFLVNEQRQLLSIGYAIQSEKLDESCYDLLASEARLASFVAIAKGDLATKHWFRLGRTLLPVRGASILVSWSGSMFEYLMPSLVMTNSWHSLLGSTSRSVVKEQIRHGQKHQTPWGVSESAYNARDVEFTYQYSNFGVPELGLKRGLGDNIVIAPYATGLASMIAPNYAAKNYSLLAALGARGTFGFYEALDFTKARVAPSQKYEVVKAYMAHHQGMTIVALANAILGDLMPKRFHSEPIVQAAELLLQERAPRLLPKTGTRATLIKPLKEEDEFIIGTVRRTSDAHGNGPDCHILSNGRYSTVVTAAGSGYSRWNGLAITRWRADPTTDDLGSYVYLRDVHSGATWSAGYLPVATPPQSYEAAFSEDRVQISRQDGTLKTVLDVIISPEDDAECRRVSITNGGRKDRTIEVTSYAELVLGPLDADIAHPAFSKLFIETYSDPATGAVLAHRRRRSMTDPEIWAAHVMSADVQNLNETQFSTDRAKFIGRGRNLSSPMGIINNQAMDATVGTVLDPIFAQRRRVTIAPGATVRLSFWTIVSTTRDALQPLIEKYRDPSAFARSSTLAWSHALVELRHFGINADEALLYQQLASHILYSTVALRAPQATLKRGALGFGALWPEGISGDLPILLVRLAEVEDVGLVRQLLHAHQYWRNKGVEVDIVILNDRPPSYQQELQDLLETLCRSIPGRHRLGRDNSKGSVFLLRADLLQPQTLTALPAAARVVFNARRGSLAEQLATTPTRETKTQPTARRSAPADLSTVQADPKGLEFFNGLGGFKSNGRDYVTVLQGVNNTPTPWINVIANPSFGFQVAADGGGYTWSINSRERQITPWANDPVTNRPGEVIYVRDEETFEIWTPTASPIRDYVAPYTVTHGQGFTRFEYTSRGLVLVLEQFVASTDPVKISRLTVRNISGRPRRLSITTYVEWVLGSSRRTTAPFIETEYDARTGAILARNPWHPFFPERVSFCHLSGRLESWTTDRSEFLGRNGSLENPAALQPGNRLSKKSGISSDPCAAHQTLVSLPISGVTETTFLLGDASTGNEVRTLVERYTAIDPKVLLQESVDQWDTILGTIQISTPDRALDILMNGWLPYQTLSCRIWARAGLYQAGGAFGFRDQLQDGMSLAMIRPDITRAHLLVAAARQFLEGDVQHWWLPASGHGIRTKIADTALWLSYAVTHYVQTSGDLSVLDESIPFLDGPELSAVEHEAYFLPEVSDVSGSLYEHCARALDRSLATGEHGLALFGGGDWNDGMNRVGKDGKGESVWLTWFLYTCLQDLIPHAENRGDNHRAARWRDSAANLKVAVERDGWDGEWYRRGYFDDGSPLGTSRAEECRIDAIAQSWSVISKAADPERSRIAMSSATKYLIDEEAKLALLFAPPFDQTQLDPGYIKGYPAGVRENGGQYTHAAAWSIIALAQLGDGDGAWKLLSMINPINLSATRADSRRYKVEPYVMAADVYSQAPHVGRGGWSWYTGSAGWIYRAALEHILGVKKVGDSLLISPCIPRNWPGFKVSYKFETTRYVIEVSNPNGVSRGLVSGTTDGVPVILQDSFCASIPLDNTRGVKSICIVMGGASQSEAPPFNCGNSQPPV